LDPRLELRMKPLEYLATMTMLDFPSHLANGEGKLPLLLQAVALFLQKDIGQHRQGPEPHNSGRSHQVIVIQAQFFLPIAEEDFDIPACRHMNEQGLGPASRSLEA
jgi:hypothetical protein